MNVSADIEEVDRKTSLEHKSEFPLGDVILGISSLQVLLGSEVTQ